jgi:CRP-like cAMP-binding protein
MPAHQAELSRCPVFSDMTPDECLEFMQHVEEVQYPAGEVILREGRSLQILWILIQGDCEVVKSMPRGQERQLAVLNGGALFGEMSFFKPAPHSASVRALTDVKLLRLSVDRFRQLERTHPQIAYKIAAGTAQVLSDRLRRMNELINEFVERPDTANHREELEEFRAKLYGEWAF